MTAPRDEAPRRLPGWVVLVALVAIVATLAWVIWNGPSL